mmetsp:Transcript_66012/g.190435  ORF Transcript_66012/g.190435 Transcript_66012/m.190435 type:complete len:208 (+) Transcript_66012:322-945(+)
MRLERVVPMGRLQPQLRRWKTRTDHGVEGGPTRRGTSLRAGEPGRVRRLQPDSLRGRAGVHRWRVGAMGRMAGLFGELRSRPAAAKPPPSRGALAVRQTGDGQRARAALLRWHGRGLEREHWARIPRDTAGRVLRGGQADGVPIGRVVALDRLPEHMQWRNGEGAATWAPGHDESEGSGGGVQHAQEGECRLGAAGEQIGTPECFAV